MLDGITNGFPPQFLVVLAARVSVGKSAFAMQLGRRFVNDKKRVLYLSLELTREMFLGRWIAQEAGISYTRWRTNTLYDEERSRLEAAVARSQESFAYLSLYACGELREQTRDSIIQLVMREPPEQRPEAIIVDLITNLRPVPSERGIQDWLRLDRETEVLRELAVQTNCTMFVVCQLNRDVTKRKDKRPMLSDIRASGAIEQNADQVLLLDNPDVIGARDRGLRLPDQQQMFINVSKNRNGRSGSVEVQWLAESMTIRELPPLSGWGTPPPQGGIIPEDDLGNLWD